MIKKVLICLLAVSIFSLGAAGSALAKTAAAEEAHEPETAASTKDSLEITANDVNVVIAFSEDGKFHFEYDNSKFTVDTTQTDHTTRIQIGRKTADKLHLEDRVEVCIPDIPYAFLKGVSENGAFNIPAVNADITVINHSGAVSVELPSDFSKAVTYTADSGACTIGLNGNTDVTVNASISDSAVSLPDGWPAFNYRRTEYSHTSGSGTAKINFEARDCAVSIKK